MFIVENPSFDILTGRRLSGKRIWYAGPVALCKGPSAQETAIANQQAGFFKTLQDSYGQIFANQATFRNALSNQYNNILAGGPGQFGYTPQEEASIRGTAMAQGAGAFQNANEALQQRLASQISPRTGAGAAPSGTAAQLQATLGAANAQQEATAQNQITQTGYDIGRQNYWSAMQGLQGLTSITNPEPYAGAATSAGGQAFSSADTVNKENQAGSFGNIVGGILGSVAPIALGAVTGGSSLPFTSALGGSWSGIGGNSASLPTQSPVIGAGGGESFYTPTEAPSFGSVYSTPPLPGGFI